MLPILAKINRTWLMGTERFAMAQVRVQGLLPTARLRGRKDPDRHSLPRQPQQHCILTRDRSLSFRPSSSGHFADTKTAPKCAAQKRLQDQPVMRRVCYTA